MSEKQTFIQKVAKIQKELKAPKSQRNKFGNYNYRNQEDILEAVKPLLGDLVLTLDDEIVEVGGRVYVRATARITDGSATLERSAYAREALEQKGMADAQLTGATSSYARKYALNGLFLIDDTKDADSDEVTALTKGEKVPAKTEPLKTAMKEAKETGTKVTVTPAEKVTQADPENAVAATPAPKKGAWGAKKTTPKADSGDLY